MLGKTKSFGDGNVIRAKNANITIKTDVLPELEDGEIVETNKGELAFGYNYTNVFSKILMKFNQLCCFKFTYNYVKKEKTRKWRLPRFTVKAKCIMDDCSVEAKIQQFYLDMSTLENKLTIYLEGEVYHKVGNLKSRIIIDNEKSKIYNYFQENPKEKPSSVYRKKLHGLGEESFMSGNRTTLGKTISTIQTISSTARKVVTSISGISDGIRKLQEKIVEKERKLTNKHASYGYIQYPSISISGLQLLLFDEGLVRLFHLIAETETFYFDPSGSFVSAIPAIKDKDGKAKRILLYALMVKNHEGKSPPVAIFEHVTTDHNIIAIRQPFLRFKDMETRLFGLSR